MLQARRGVEMQFYRLREMALGGIWFVAGLLLALIVYKPQLIGLDTLDYSAQSSNPNSPALHELRLISPRELSSKALNGVEALAMHTKDRAVSLNQTVIKNKSFALGSYRPFEKRLQLSVPVYAASSNRLDDTWASLKASHVASYLILVLLTLLTLTSILTLMFRLVSWATASGRVRTARALGTFDKPRPPKPKQGLFWPLG